MLLIAFASAVQALRCTIAIQEQLRFKSDGRRLRIGVHQSEVAVSLARTSWLDATTTPLTGASGHCASCRNRRIALRTLTAAYALAGNLPEAHRTLAMLREVQPSFRFDYCERDDDCCIPSHRRHGTVSGWSALG